MSLREASIGDIPQIQFVRNSVKENQLSDPALVPDSDVIDYLINRGKGWVWETGGRIVGFAIISLVDKNVWALFIEPGFEKLGIGRQLHEKMIDWYFQHTNEPVWLGTAPGTRAEKFYRQAGWKEIGLHGKGEIKFELTADHWRTIS